MAQPISLHLTPRNCQHELDVRLQRAPQEHAEALLASYQLLQELHDKGVLEVMRGTLGGGEKILEQIVIMAKEPESIRAIRNLILVAKALGDVDPALLGDLTRAVPESLARSTDEQDRPPGFFKLLRTFRDKDFRRGLAAGVKLVTAFGKNHSEEASRNK